MTDTQPADEPGTRMVDVWVASLDGPLPLLEALASSLSGAERERAARYRFSRDARRFSATRGWLRLVLGAELAVPPGSVRLTEDGAKPRLANRTGPHFNVSHASELALIAVSSDPVGVDVEPVEHSRFDLGMVELACTAAEAEALDRLPVGHRALAFLRLWTAKEAYLKATGDGLSVEPPSVEIGLSQSENGAPVQAAGGTGDRQWWVRRLQPAYGYIGAVAAEGRDWQIRMRSTAELSLDGRGRVPIH